MGGLVPVSILEYAAKSSDVPLCRCEDPFGDSDVTEVFVVLDDGKAGVVVTLWSVTNVRKRLEEKKLTRGPHRKIGDDVPLSRRFASA